MSSSRKLSKDCPICNKIFLFYKPSSGNRVCCSLKCKYILHSIMFSGKNNPLWNRIDKVCVICGEIFSVINSFKNQKCCSNKCVGVYRTGKNNPNWHDSIKKYCVVCNGVFYVKPSLCGHICCSYKCAGIYRGLKNRGKNHYKWCGGKKFHFDIEYKSWIRDILKRDNYKCKICGSNIKLNAHHIYPKSKYPELVFYEDNGITLCKKCHMYFTNVELQFIDLFERLME